MIIFIKRTFAMAKKTAPTTSKSPLNDNYVGTSGPDVKNTGNGHDKLSGLAGNDTLGGGNGKDTLKGGSGSDTLHGNNGKDLILGDGASELGVASIDLDAASTWSGFMAGSTSLSLPGLTLTSVGGALTQYHGASVLSPTDGEPKDFTNEIDAYNDTPEAIHVAFATAQTSVTLTLRQLYQEHLFQPYAEAEKVVLDIHFTDGSTVHTIVSATATTAPGEATVTLASSSYGGRLIASIDLSPDLSLPDTPSKPNQAASYNATHPYSEFTLKAVAYTRDFANDPGNNDFLKGGNGKDVLKGGAGNDTLSGGNGADTLIGGSGDNTSTGGNGPDTFVFSFRSNGHDRITDFKIGEDHLRLDDGIAVVSVDHTAGGDVLHLSSGGDVTLTGVTGLSDWHVLL